MSKLPTKDPSQSPKTQPTTAAEKQRSPESISYPQTITDRTWQMASNKSPDDFNDNEQEET